MSSVNLVVIMGRLGRDPESRDVMVQGNNTFMCQLAIATNRGNDKVDWHRVELWGKTAELAAKYLSKGRMIHIEGTIHYQKWEDKEGNARISTVIKGHRMTFVPDGKGNKEDEEIPF